MAKFTITVEIDDAQVDSALARFLLKMGVKGAPIQAPAASDQPKPAAARDETPSSDGPECDACGGEMTWKPAKPGSQYKARYWCNTYGCKGKPAA